MSQQRHLETLRERAMRGERPAVTVGNATYEFSGVVWGGASPRVQLIDPSGTPVSRSAAEWTRMGAKFVGRSRSLARATAAGRAGLARRASSPREVIVREVMVPAPTPIAPAAVAPAPVVVEVPRAPRTRSRTPRSPSTTAGGSDKTPSQLNREIEDVVDAWED
jgi:hypothetical protein